MSRHFCIMQVTGYVFVMSNSKSFIPQILKVVYPLGEKLIYYSSLGFVIQKNCDSETSDFKLSLFRAFQRYLTDKNPRHIRGTPSSFQFSARCLIVSHF